MATQFGIQPSFARGEISPRLHARVDIDHWRVSLAKALNWIVMRHGGIRRRPPTQFVAMTKLQGAGDRVRTLPFRFSTTQAYVLELGANTMRVLGLGGLVMSGGVPYEVATPWSGADLFSLQFEREGDEIYVVHPNYPPHKVRRLGETNWQVVPVSFKDGPYLDVNTTATRITPSSTGHIVPPMTSDSDGGYVVSASSVYSDGGGPREAYMAFDRADATEWMSQTPAPAWVQIEHPSSVVVSGYSIRASAQIQSITELVAPDTYNYQKVTGGLRAPRTWRLLASNNGVNWVVLDTRSGETGWGDGERRFYSFENEIAYRFYRLDVRVSNLQERPVSIAEWALQGAGPDAPTITLAASSTAGINGGRGFLAGDVGRLIRILGQDAYWHWLEITSWVSTTEIAATLRSPPLSSLAGWTSWRLGAFGAVPGYPRAVSFFLGRLTYGGTVERPLGVYGSVVNDFDNFSQSIPLKPDEAFSFTVGVGGQIQWLLDGGDVLIIGTDSALRSLGPANKNDAFSATNIQQGKPAYTGAGPAMPVKVGQTPVFVGQFQNNLREAAYSFDAQGFTAPDISVLSEHLFRARIAAMDYAQDPNSTIWCRIGDGSLVAFTYEKEQQMTAFTPHVLGGAGAFVENVVVIPGVGRHEVWLTVRRTRPDGTNMRTHERFAADFESPADPRQAHFSDCSATYSGAPATTITGLDHLNGWEVAVTADGAEQKPVTVIGGTITIPDGQPSRVIHVGLPYESRLKTLRTAQGFGDGSGLGRKKRVKSVMLDLLETGQAKVRASAGEFQEINLRDGSEVMGEPPPLVTDRIIPVPLEDRWNGQGVIEVLCDSPRPATIRAITLGFDGE